MAFNVSVSLFAGTTSVVVGSLVALTGDLNWPAYYLPSRASSARCRSWRSASRRRDDVGLAAGGREPEEAHDLIASLPAAAPDSGGVAAVAPGGGRVA